MGRSARSSHAEIDLFKILDARTRVRHRGDGFRLVGGDCLEVMAALPEHSIDLIFADPPYLLSNGGTTCSSGRRVAVDKGRWDASAGLQADHDWNVRWLSACRRVLKPSGTIWVSGTQHVIFSIGFAMQTLGFHLLNTITWFKPNASPNLACRFFTHSTEIVLWASPSRLKPLAHTFHYREMKAENGGKQMRDLWQLPEPDGDQVVWSLPTPGKSEKRSGRHPTQKPRSLLDRIVRAGSSPGEVVLDPFNGSGTTGLAARGAGRRYIGIDVDTTYLDLTHKRLRDQP
jgi:site-specific DNA-methyltransferase (adenine-specific)